MNLSRAELTSQIQAFDPEFKFSKKKHTLAILSSLLKKASAKSGEKKSRMKQGYQGPTGEFSMPKADSKRYMILSAMKKGTTVTEIAKITSWPRHVASGALRTDVRNLGWGFDVKGDVITLATPKDQVALIA